MNELLSHLDTWRPVRVLVIGDFMLDQLVYGDAERLTGDAPVPILRVRRTTHNPGGASNVCANLAAMRAEVRAFGVTGDDPEARLLVEELTDAGINCDGLVPDPERPTTVKRNLIGLAQHRHPQKMFRLDYESDEPLPDAVIDEIVNRFDAALGEADIVAIEDYNKGVCTEALCQAVIRRAKERGVPVLVDPASITDYSRYRGATAITPNRTEAERATGIRTHDEADPDHNAQLARELRTRHQLDAVVLTLDRHGALLLEGEGDPVTIPTVARAVYDVTGAGDMVLAALLAARANGISWHDAVVFANVAAGLEVERFGCVPIPLERIHQSILALQDRAASKLRTLDEARVEVAAARREGRTVAFTNGCFDVLHAGHIQLLKAAAKHGDLLIVAINSDSSVRRLKGEDRPVHPEHDRASILSELQSVDIVLIFEEDTPIPLLETLRPDVLVKGADYSREQVVGHELVESWGGRIELIDFLTGRSTTAAIERMRNS